MQARVCVHVYACVGVGARGCICTSVASRPAARGPGCPDVSPGAVPVAAKTSCRLAVAVRVPVTDLLPGSVCAMMPRRSA